MLQDLRYALRMLTRKPGFTLVAVLTLTLGIGANVSIFSVANALLIRPLPFPDADRLVYLGGRAVSPGTVEPLRAAAQSFDAMAPYSMWEFTLTGVDDPEVVSVFATSAGFLRMLAARPLAGRLLTEADDQPGAEPVVLISQRLWQRHFNADPQAMGRTLRLDGKAYAVVGVIPDHQGQLWYSGRDIWIPSTAIHPPNVSVLARLRPGVTLERALAELESIAGGLELDERARRSSDPLVVVLPIAERMVGEFRTTILVLAGAVGFVLLIACANIANLLLARMTARSQEMAVRAALGASRARLIRQVLAEGLLVSLAGAAGGLLLAAWGIDAFRALAPYHIPRLETVSFDGLVLAFTLGLALLTPLIFGLAPARAVIHRHLAQALAEAGRSGAGTQRQQRLRNALAVSEIALAVILVAGAGLLIKSFLVLRFTSPGLELENRLVVLPRLDPVAYGDPATRREFYQHAVERVQSLPGVRDAAAVTSLPLTGMTAFVMARTPGPEPHEQRIHFRAATPNIISVLGMTVLRGRGLSEGDHAQAPRVGVVNETFARLFWPGAGPLGRTLAVADPLGRTVSIELPGAPLEFTVVGVLRDARIHPLDTGARPEFYVTFEQSPWAGVIGYVVAHTEGDAARSAAPVQAALRSLDPNLPFPEVTSMEGLMFESVRLPRFHALLLGTLAGVALVLATVGIYGVLAYSVSQRSREFGIRMALGAQRAHILRGVAGEGLLLAGIGLSLGLGGAAALTRVLTNLLFDVKPIDTWTFVATAALLGAVAVLACWIPARRATKVDPMVALRYE